MLYLCILLLSCFIILLWGMKHADRIYQYPFLISSIFLSFIFPQAYALVLKPFFISKEAVEDILIMACLCAWMSLIGYRLNCNPRILQKLNIEIDEIKFFRSGIVLVFISFFAGVVLSKIAPSTNDVGNWTGPATILYFFANTRYIAAAIFLGFYLRKKHFSQLAWFAFSVAPIFQTVFIYGRRTPIFILLSLIGASLFFVKRITPPRLLVFPLLIAGTLLIPLIGELRGDFWAALLSGNLSEINFTSGIDRIFVKSDVLEFRNAAMLLETANTIQKFGFGTGYWNDIVFQYVPGQLVGYDVKEALQLNLGVTSQDLINVFGFSFSPGSTKTGIGDAYAEFGFLGCFIFGFIAHLYKNIWTSALLYNSMISQILYIGLLGPALIGVTHGIGRFLQDAIFQLIFIGFCVKYSKMKNVNYS